MLKNWPVLAAIVMVCSLSSALALADGSVDDLGRLLDDSTGLSSASVKQIKVDGPLRLTTNKDEIIRLDQDAASVIVNNPEHAEVMLDSPRLLIIMPRQPGATSFTVLNGKSETILQQDIIVTNVQPQYVRVRRMCGANDSSCVPAAYYYCPDGCYEVTSATSGGGGSVPPPVGGAAANLAAETAPASSTSTPDAGPGPMPASGTP